MSIPIRAAILDDERGSIETPQALLARDCPEVTLVATFEYPDLALQEQTFNGNSGASVKW